MKLGDCKTASQGHDGVEMTVLLVDDNAMLLRQAESYLKQRGLEVICNDSPFGVGRLLLREKPSVLVLDVQMPGLDGEGLHEALGHNESLPPVIFYSAMEEEQLYQLCKRRPGTSYVLKSDGLGALYDAIQRAK
jgi:DNA-binding response OmpR family regulator